MFEFTTVTEFFHFIHLLTVETKQYQSPGEEAAEDKTLNMLNHVLVIGCLNSDSNDCEWTVTVFTEEGKSAHVGKCE